MGNAGAALALVIEDAEEGNYLAAALGALPFGIQGVKAFKSVKIIKKSKGRIVSEEVITGAQAAERAGTAPRNIQGQWRNVAESMSDRARAYQQQVTGKTGQSFFVNGVKFDGVGTGVLLDAKGPGYANFVRNGRFRDWFTGADSLVKQAKDQLRAANGTPIQWHVAEADAVTAIRNLFADRGITGIDIIHTPVLP